MKVCFVNPAWQENGGQGVRAGSRIPALMGTGEASLIPFPFILAYGMAIVERLPGVEAMIIDGIAEGLSEAAYLAKVEAFQPDLLVSEMATASADNDLRLAAAVRERTGALIAMTGPHPSALPREVMADSTVDFILLGEIEHYIGELVTRLRDGLSVQGLNGVAHRIDGTIRVEPRAVSVDLSALPLPHRETLPIAKYRVGGMPAPTLILHASRGCPFKCNFCLWTQTMYKFGEYRGRTPADIVDEIKQATERFGPFASVYFDDDTFNVGKTRMLAFADEMERRNIKTVWGCNARPDLFDDETMGRLAAVGLLNFRIGVESGDPEILRRANKNLKLESVRRCMDLARKHGVGVHIYLTVGLSGESRASVDRTIAFIRSLRPDSVSVSVTTPYPGTEYFEEITRNGFLLADDWSDFNAAGSPVMRTEQLSAAQLNTERRRAMLAIYRSPAFILRRLRYTMNSTDLFAMVRKGGRLLIGR